MNAQRTARVSSKGRSFVWRGERRHRHRPWVPGGHQSEHRRTLNVPIGAYIGLCAIADQQDTTITGALTLVLKDLP